MLLSDREIKAKNWWCPVIIAEVFPEGFLPVCQPPNH